MTWIENLSAEEAKGKPDAYDLAANPQAERDLRARLKGKVIGRPRATGSYTVEQLESMGLVGLYDPNPRLRLLE